MLTRCGQSTSRSVAAARSTRATVRSLSRTSRRDSPAVPRAVARRSASDGTTSATSRSAAPLMRAGVGRYGRYGASSAFFATTRTFAATGSRSMRPITWICPPPGGRAPTRTMAGPRNGQPIPLMLASMLAKSSRAAGDIV